MGNRVRINCGSGTGGGVEDRREQWGEIAVTLKEQEKNKLKVF